MTFLLLTTGLNSIINILNNNNILENYHNNIFKINNVKTKTLAEMLFSREYNIFNSSEEIQQSELFKLKDNERLSENELKTLHDYSNSKFREINSALRSHSFKNNNLLEYYINNIDNAISKTEPLKKPVITFRCRFMQDNYQNPRGGEELFCYKNINNIFINPSYVSSSLLKASVSENSAHETCEYVILLPKGFQCLLVPNSDFYDEAELLLPRNTIFKVEAIFEIGNLLNLDNKPNGEWEFRKNPIILLKALI